MKYIPSIFLIAVLLLTACTGVRTFSTGLENESFLEFIGNSSNYSGGVSVLIDDQVSFNAQVENDDPARVKGKVYALSTGKHIVSVSYKNNVIFKKQIFISAQETKKILLP